MRSVRELLLVAVVVLTGCATEESPWRPDSTGQVSHLANRACPPDSTLTWGNFGAPFMLDWCTGCHADTLGPDARADAPMEIDLNRLEEVRANMDLVWAEAGDHNTTMPPAGGPTAEERALLGEWLACGALTRNELATLHEEP